MNPTVKSVLLNERANVLSAIAAREGTVADLMVQLAAVENDMWRLRHRLIDLESYLIGRRVALEIEDAGATPGASLPDAAPEADPELSEPGTLSLPACRPLEDFVRQRAGKRRPAAALEAAEDA